MLTLKDTLSYQFIRYMYLKLMQSCKKHAFIQFLVKSVFIPFILPIYVKKIRPDDKNCTVYKHRFYCRTAVLDCTGFS